MNLTPEEYARFMAKVEISPAGCHLWTGPLDKDGYGSFYLRRLSRRAHRVGWFLMHGEIPKGYVVNHKCRVRRCVNHQHLGLLTVRENSLIDSSGLGAVNRRKTHCPRGHAYDKTVTYGGKTQRVCSACERAKQRRLYAKWQAENTLSV